jgi:hypothetical protein
LWFLNSFFLDWANSFDKDTPGFIPGTEHHSAYFIPENYDESNYKSYLKNNFETIFEEELSAQINDPELWPTTLDFKLFKRWFDVHACDIVFDLSEEPLIKKDF